MTEDGHTLYLELDAEASTTSGSGGCNRFAGSFEVSGARLHLGPVATTLRAGDEEIIDGRLRSSPRSRLPTASS